MELKQQFSGTLPAMGSDRDTDAVEHGMSLTRALERLEKAIHIHGEHLGRVRELADIAPQPERGEGLNRAEPMPDLAVKLIRRVACLSEEIEAQTARLGEVGQFVERLR